MIVSTVRAVGRLAGKALDAEDRKLVGIGLVYIGSLALAIILMAGAIGLALQAFEAARSF